MNETNKNIIQYQNQFNEWNKQNGKRWAASAMEGSVEAIEWSNESKRIIINNHSSADITLPLPWPEILVFAPAGKKSFYQMTRNAWIMVGLREGYDRLSYEAKNGTIIVTVWRNRVAIKTWGTRRKRKILKAEAIRMIEHQLSIYYGVAAKIHFSRCKNAYIVNLTHYPDVFGAFTR